jgi:hypothetical protein
MMRRTSGSFALPTILFTLALCSVFIHVTDAAVILFRDHHESLPQQQAALHLRDTACGIPGNPDIYGLGIRLGLYMLWTATIFTYEFLEDEVSSAIDTNVIFFFSIGVATFVISTESPKPDAEEIYILLCMFFGGFWSLAFPSKANSFSLFGLSIRMYLMAGMAAYALWFWFRGMDKFRQQPCGSQVFLFAKVALFGHARTFFKIASVLNFLAPALYLFFMELFLFMPGLISFSVFLVIVPPIVVIWAIIDLCRGKISTWKITLSEVRNETELWQTMVSAAVMFTKPMGGISKDEIKEKVQPAIKQRRRNMP